MLTPFEIRHFHLFAGLGGGARGFICSRTPRPRCACGKPSAFQCDAPASRRRGILAPSQGSSDTPRRHPSR